MHRNLLSTPKPLYAGVPQGSVLGPLLFLIYVNDVADNMVTFCRLFADDNSLQHSSHNMKRIEKDLNKDLNALEIWSKKWLLKFNPSKTKVIMFSTKKHIEYPKLLFQQCELDFITEHKHLGVLFSHDASWSPHIDNILSIAYKKLSLLKKLKFKVNRKTLSLMYTSFIRPQLEYASVVWGCCQQGDSDKLEKLQLYAARIVTGLTTIASKDSLYFETGWEPLSCRRQEARLKTMFKLHNNLVPEYLMDILPNMRCNTSIYSTRNSQNYDIPKCRLQTYKSTFIPTVVNEWNSIPLETRNLQSMSKFKSKISNKKSRSAPPSYFDYGNRRLNVLQTRLRHNCVLNNDLFRCNLISSPLCTCGKVEDTYHYFFVCPKYANARNEFFT